MLAVLVAIQLAPVKYEPSRYDMGVRLQAVDRAWMRARPTEKQAAVPSMQRAVTLFFGGNFGEVSRALDEALAKLRKAPLDPAWAMTWRPTKSVFEAGDAVTLQGHWAYSPVGTLPPGTQFGTASEVTLGPAVLVSNKVSGFAHEAGGGQPIAVFGAPQWDALKAQLSEAKDPTEAAVVTRLVDIVEGRVQKSSSPDLFAYTTAATTIRAKGLAAAREIPYVRHEGTEFRIAFPKRLAAKPDILIALHGAGGEADMFFESYGAGIWPKTALAKGMVFASPATSAVAPQAVLNWLRDVRKIEAGRVFVVGHSMGGGAAIGAISRLKTPPAGVLLLAPAAGTLPAQAKGIPLFLAVGDQEMMMLKGMADRLQQGVLASPMGQSIVVPNTEHLMVVADAARAGFEWMEKVRSRK